MTGRRKKVRDKIQGLVAEISFLRMATDRKLLYRPPMDTQADRNYRESSVYTVARESNPTLVEFSYEYIMCVKHFEISSMLLRHTINHYYV